jgi:hypothetical protein
MDVFHFSPKKDPVCHSATPYPAANATKTASMQFVPFEHGQQHPNVGEQRDGQIGQIELQFW